MTATDIANFQCAIGELVDAMARFRGMVVYQGIVAGMQAENANRAQRGESVAYIEAHFVAVAREYGFR